MSTISMLTTTPNRTAGRLQRNELQGDGGAPLRAQPQPQTDSAELDPAFHQRILAARLRRARKNAGLTQARVGQLLEWSTAKVLRIENHQVVPSATDLRALLGVYGIADEPSVVEYLTLRRAARGRGWAEGLRALAPEFVDHVGLQFAASTIRQVATRLIPDLIRTPRYARAVDEAWGPPQDTPEVLDQLAVAHERRMSRLWRGPGPAVSLIIDELALCRRIGGTDTLAEQLQHLRQIAHHRRARVRVLPMAVASPAMRGPFEILEFRGELGDPSLDPLLVTDDAYGHPCACDDAAALSEQFAVFERVERFAASPNQSMTIIDAAIRQLADPPPGLLDGLATSGSWSTDGQAD